MGDVVVYVFVVLVNAVLFVVFVSDVVVVIVFVGLNNFVGSVSPGQHIWPVGRISFPTVIVVIALL